MQYEDHTCALQYTVTCDAHWRTRGGTVLGWVGSREVDLTIRVDAAQRWWLNERPYPELDGCIDVDYGFSPATNTLPIRRLALAPRASASVRAAWLQFPSFQFTALEQTYRAVSPSIMHYESNGGLFQAELEIDAHGVVRQYAGLWTAESPNQ